MGDVGQTVGQQIANIVLEKRHASIGASSGPAPEQCESDDDIGEDQADDALCAAR